MPLFRHIPVRRTFPAVALSLMSFAALSAASCHLPARKPEVFVPIQKTAREQFLYAMDYQDRNDIVLRNKARMDRLTSTRESVRKAFETVVRHFPEDREVTPLAKLMLAEILAGMDISRLPAKEKDLREAVRQLNQIEKEYPELEHVQAKTRFDKAICYRNLREYENAMALFKEVQDSYAASKDKDVAQLVRMAGIYYNQIYVK